MNWKKKILSCIVLLVFLAVVFAIGYWKQEGIPVFGKTLDEAGEKKIALTFDDGPHPYYTEQLLDGLKKRGVKATFFVTGAHAELHPEVIKRMSEEGG